MVLPAGWVIDPISVERLRRRLARSDTACTGVAALRADLAPGSSYRVAAERRVLAVPPPARSDGAAAHAEPTTESASGAVLMRRDVVFDIADDVIIEPSGGLIVERGAVSHDPWRNVGALEDASPEGRPPFPWRPVVVFLGFRDDLDLADWVRSTVNVLVRRRTEGRVAVPMPTGGLHLTRPCLPTAESVAALAPDVVVALDGEAVDAAEAWLGDDRSATIINLTQETDATVDLVSWRIGEARGRLRARIGRGVDGGTLADLVRRLCAGPHPVPPSKGPAPGLRISGRRRPPGPSPQTASIVLLGQEPADQDRFGGFADHARAAGAAVSTLAVDSAAPEVSGADIVMLRGASGSVRTLDLVADRRRRGLATVVDLGPGDLWSGDLRPGDLGTAARVGAHPEAGAEPRSGSVPIRASSRRLARASGLVTVSDARIREIVRRQGVRSILLPSLVSRQRLAELEQARGAARSELGTRLGWWVDAAAGGPTPSEQAVSDALDRLVASRPGLVVDVVGESDRVASLLDHRPAFELSSGSPDVRRRANWSLQVCIDEPTGSRRDAGSLPVIEGQLLGVPTLVGAGSPAAADGLAVPGLVVEGVDASRWSLLIGGLLSDPQERARRSLQAHQLADGLYGQIASAAIVNRVLGWIRTAGAR